MSLSHAQIEQFKIDGYLILPNLLSQTDCLNLTELTQHHLQRRIEPFELEAQVQYPGSPTSPEAEGGQTIRRLLMAYQRDSLYAHWATHRSITHSIKQILDSRQLYLNPNHHNCIMTKQPQYSSKTMWHRDTRYWQFNNKYLINAWFALGNEFEANGGMKILPGSHRWVIKEQYLDDAEFLIPEHPDNQQRLNTQRLVNLNQGDVLLFSAHCFHAAGNNSTNSKKYSMVFTYHGEKTKAIIGSKSDKLPVIPI